MPQAVAEWVFTQAGLYGLGTTAAEIAAGIAYAGVIAAEAYAMSSYTAAQVDENASFKSKNLVVRSSKAPQTIVYGKTWTGGALIYENQYHQANSKDNFVVVKAVAHAGRQCESIDELFFDNDYIPASDINWGTGHITGGKYGIPGIGGTYAVDLEKYLGTSTQTQSPILTTANPTDYPASPGDYRARGIAYTVFRFTYSSVTTQDPSALFYSGVPENIRALIRGAKVYDPRLDSTNGGSGSQRFDTPSGWAWTDNPILCAADYMTQYMAINFFRIDWAWVRAQADICDATVSIPDLETSRWEFNETADGWTTAGLTSSTNSTYWTIDSTGGDPIIRRTITIDGTANRYIRARVRRTAGSGWDGKCYYSGGVGSHGESESFTKDISDATITGQWVTLEWDMWALTAGGTDWSASTNVTGLRLDFGSTASDTFDIDWITVSSNAKTEARYTCNGVVALTRTHKENLTDIMSSCAGYVTKVGGLWRPTAGGFVSPSVTLTDVDIVSGDDAITYVGSTGRDQRYNSVTGIYFSPDNFTQEVDSLPMESSAFVTRDGGDRLPKSLALPMTNSEYQAQRICYKFLLQSDQQKSITLQCRWTGLAVAVGDRVNLSLSKYNWSNKVFRCSSWQLNPSGSSAPIQMTLTEDASAAWADPLISEYSVRTNGAVTPGTVLLPTPTAGSGIVGEVTVANGNFEIGDWYWMPSSAAWSIVPDSTNSHQGSWVAKCTSTSNSAETLTNSIKYTCTPGTRVHFGGFAKTDSSWTGAGLDGISFGVNFLDSSSSILSTEIAQPYPMAADTPYTHVADTVIAPANTQFVQFLCQASSGGGAAYVDDTFMTVFGPSVDESGLTNVLPPWLGDVEMFQRSDCLVWIGSGGDPTIVPDSSVAYIGRRSIKVTNVISNGAESGIDFCCVDPAGNIVPQIFVRANRRWLFIAAIRPSNSYAAGTDSQYRVAIRESGGTQVVGGYKTFASSGQWYLAAWVLDCSAQSFVSARIWIAMKNIAAKGGAPIWNLDAMQLLDVTDMPWIDETNFPTTFRPGTGSSAGLFRRRSILSDETISSQTSVSAYGNLYPWNMEPNVDFLIEGQFSFTSGATPDFQFQIIFDFNAPQSSSAVITGIDGAGTAINAAVSNLHSTPFFVAGGAGTGVIKFSMNVRTHATDRSNAGFGWAQNTSDASNTILLYGTWMSVQRLTYP